jgi:hypothetical protein
MDEGSPQRGNRRGIRRKAIVILVALVLLALLGPNLWLASPFGRSWIAGKIQARIGLETRVGGASISPWSGITVSHIELLQPPPLRAAVPQPLARIAFIHLSPVWRAWLRGRLELTSISFDSPELVVPVELLADVARTRAQATQSLPAVAAAEPSPPQATPVPPAADTPPAPAQTPAPAQAQPVLATPTGWIRLQNASFTLISASSGKRWFHTDGISGSIPVSGGPAESPLRIGSVNVAEQSVLTDIGMTLDWRAPLLAVKPFESEIEGLKFVMAGKIGLVAGLPMQFEAQFPEQSPQKLPLPSGMEAKVASINANARFRGLLLAPGTWQGDLVTGVVAPSARIGAFDATFDRGSAVTVLRGGVISCVDARLIGDELSFLGNATLLSDGRAAAALRMVAPPASIEAIVGRTFTQLPQPFSITPLSTPQRAAFDLTVFGNLQQLYLRMGGEGPVMQLRR